MRGFQMFEGFFRRDFGREGSKRRRCRLEHKTTEGMLCGFFGDGTGPLSPSMRTIQRTLYPLLVKAMPVDQRKPTKSFHRKALEVGHTEAIET
jgi:hypothetical protein